MGKFADLGHDLYEGRVSYDFVGRRRLWYVVSLVIVVLALGGLLGRGLNMGLEFRGGTEFTISTEGTQDNADRFGEIAENSGVDVGQVSATTSGVDKVLVQTQPLSQSDADVVEEAFVEAGASEVSQQSIGATWGAQILDRALLALCVFLVLVVLFIWAYFREWKMSVSALVALAHDVIITVGVYAIVGFEVTPASVTGLLTILGYSLYDTVVVFDKVRENTRAFTTHTRSTYAELSNLAVNQTLVRSINTSVTALLPVAALLFVGVVIVGTGPLKDLALSLFVGMAAGAYSSIFIATPLAVQLKERDAPVQAQAQRVRARREHERAKGTATGPEAGGDGVAAGSTGGVPGGSSPSGAGAPGSGPAGKPAAPVVPSGASATGSKPARRPATRSTRSSAGRIQPQRRPRSQRGKGQR
ncbi:MAG: secF [Nocardioidaceae bacterium]|jgi:preprotein translocase subunit SecF|nr:secF [Nocardioidaceae bacterium]